MITMILWFLNIRHSDTLFGMWSSWVKENGTTQVIYIAKLNDGPKRVKKTFSMIFEIEVFFSSQNIDFPFYLKRLLELVSSSSFLFFHAPSLEDSGILMRFEEKITSSKTSFQMASIY
jgi:hypothetical protein